MQYVIWIFLFILYKSILFFEFLKYFANLIGWTNTLQQGSVPSKTLNYLEDLLQCYLRHLIHPSSCCCLFSDAVLKEPSPNPLKKPIISTFG